MAILQIKIAKQFRSFVGIAIILLDSCLVPAYPDQVYLYGIYRTRTNHK